MSIVVAIAFVLAPLCPYNVANIHVSCPCLSQTISYLHLIIIFITFNDLFIHMVVCFMPPPNCCLEPVHRSCKRGVAGPIMLSETFIGQENLSGFDNGDEKRREKCCERDTSPV